MPGPVYRHNGKVVPGALGAILPPPEEWLATQPYEPVLLPELPIIDTHHHLWEHPGYRYLLPEFSRDLASGHNVVSTVYVDCGAYYRATGPEAMKPLGETEFVVGQSAMAASGRFGPTRVAEGIIGFADLTLGAPVRQVLEAQVEAANGRFKGVRMQTAWDADERIRRGQAGHREGVLLEDTTREALAVLVDLHLAFDIYVFFPQLAEVAQIADAAPDLTVVLNHCGGPISYLSYAGMKDEHYRHWRNGLAEVARRPNVICKIGALLIKMDEYDYLNARQPATSEELAGYWRRWIEPCIELFGADRISFESNFPVEKTGINYATLWNTYKLISRGASDAEMTAMFSGTAARVYSLEAAV